MIYPFSESKECVFSFASTKVRSFRSGFPQTHREKAVLHDEKKGLLGIRPGDPEGGRCGDGFGRADSIQRKSGHGLFGSRIRNFQKETRACLTKMNCMGSQ